MTDRPSYPVDDDDEFGGPVTPPRRAADKDLDPIGIPRPATEASTAAPVHFTDPAAQPEQAPVATFGERPQQAADAVDYTSTPTAPAAGGAPLSPPQTRTETPADVPQIRKSRPGPRRREELTENLSTRLEVGIRRHLVDISERNGISIREVLEILIENYGDLVRPRS